MGTEVKSGGDRIIFVASKSLKKKFAKYAKEHRTSMSQVLRDFIQDCVKKKDVCSNKGDS